MQSSSSAVFGVGIETASNSHRVKKSSTKRHISKQQTTSIESINRKKRSLRMSHDSNSSDDEPKSKTVNNKGKNKPPSKKSRKSGQRVAIKTTNGGSNGRSELVSGSEDKLQVAVGNFCPKSNYSDALNLSPETGSIKEGEKLFGVLIKPIPVDTFMTQYWEQKPIRLQRRFPDFYKDLISTEVIDKMLREHHVEFTKNIDITSYKDGVRETLNPVGRAMPPCTFV